MRQLLYLLKYNRHFRTRHDNNVIIQTTLYEKVHLNLKKLKFSADKNYG